MKNINNLKEFNKSSLIISNEDNINNDNLIKNLDEALSNTEIKNFNLNNYKKFIHNYSLLDLRLNNTEKLPLFDFDLISVKKWLNINSKNKSNVSNIIHLFHNILVKFTTT